MRDKILKLARYLKSIKCYDELDYLGTVYGMYSGESIGVSKCLPIDQWEGVPEGFKIFTHSTGKSIQDFNGMIKEGFRVSKKGTGRLEITFLEETGASSLTENLRRRTSSENKNYNLGPTVVIAAINPELLMTEGMDDETLKLYSAGEGDPLGPVFLKNVKIFEKWDDDHKWRDNAWKLPGRFLYAAYDGINDTICINPNWDGSIGTAYGERLAKNKEEFLSRDMQNSMADVDLNQPKEPDIIDYKPQDGFEDDPDIF
jgi:hypothetical protein